MEIFGGFMVMVSILGLFVVIVWLLMPFVVFAIKGRQDRSMEMLEALDERLAAMQQQLNELGPLQMKQDHIASDMTQVAPPETDGTSVR